MCEAIYRGNTQQTFKKIIDGCLSDLLRLIKNRQNQIHLLPILNNTLILLRHVQTYAIT